MSIVLQKDRSVSEVLVDTIQFAKHHYELMLRPMLYIIIPIAMLAVLNQVYAYQMVTTTSAMDNDSVVMFLALTVGLGIFTFLMIFCATLIGLGAVRQVYENETDRSSTDYAGYFIRKNLLAYLGLAVLYALAYFAGLMLLVIPGIYVFFSLYPSSGAFVFERKGVIESLKRGHGLSKGNWWFIVGATLLMSLLMIGIDILTDLPAIIIGFLMGIGANPETILAGEGFSALYLAFAVLSAIGYMITFIFYALTGVHVALLFFTLRERKEGDSISDEVAGFESDLSDDTSNDGFGKDDGLSSDPDSDRNNPDWR